MNANRSPFFAQITFGRVKEYIIKHRLRWLAMLTGVTLLAIVALQIYWLVTSFSEQKARFKADIESALTATAVHMLVTHMTPERGNASLTQAAYTTVSFDWGNFAGQGNDTQIIGNDTVIIAVTRDISTQQKGRLPTEQRVYTAPEMSGNGLADTSGRRVQLVACQNTFRKELLKRQIQVPFELAIIGQNNQWIIATTDSAHFAHIPIKSGNKLDAIPFLPTNDRLQAAFPDANLYLLRRMAWTLSITTLLILICGLSFGYLLHYFFRHKRLSDIRNDFLNNMTHELKTPVTAVSVAMELMQTSSAQGRPKQDYIAMAQKELGRLTMLVDKILKMAAFDREEITLHREVFDAATWAAQTVEHMRPILDNLGATVTLTIQPQTLQIYADRTHLTNVLQNLLENALKYNKRPAPTIVVQLQMNAHSLTISVKDDGIGIPAVYLEKVFDRFFRVPTGDRHDVKGYGLGLSYVKSIVSLHGGNVEVISKEGVGSTFTIAIPQKQY